MTLRELKKRIDEILEVDPTKIDAGVLVDTEARRFNAHMIDVVNIWDLDHECGMGNIVYLSLDYSGTDN